MKKQNNKNILNQPLFLIGLWIAIPIFLYLLVILFEMIGLSSHLIEYLIGLHIFTSLFIIPALAIWIFIKSISMIKERKRITSGIIHIISSIIIVLLVGLVYWVLFFTRTLN